jgi:uncharacterized protein (DUF58 family)
MLTSELMKEVRRLQIRTSRRVDALFTGEYHSAFKGQGIEFAEVRDYLAGDDVRTIDWNVTARTGRTHVKRFEEERQLTVVLAVDLSASAGFASAGRLKSRLATEIAAVLALTAARNNDRAGLMILSDHVESFVPPRKGRAHTLRLMRDLLDFEPAGRGTDLPGALLHLDKILTQRAIVFLISDLLAPVEGPGGLANPLRRLASRHDVVTIRLTDPRDAELPRVGLVRAMEPESGRHVLLDASSRAVRRAYRAAASRHEAELDRALRGARVDRIDCATDRPFVHDLIRYFRLRETRLHR